MHTHTHIIHINVMLLINAVTMKGGEGAVVMLLCHLIERLHRERDRERDHVIFNVKTPSSNIPSFNNETPLNGSKAATNNYYSTLINIKDSTILIL
jgi:hypothetical protein